MTIEMNKCGKCTFVGPVVTLRQPDRSTPRRACKGCDPQAFEAAAEAQKEAWLRGEEI